MKNILLLVLLACFLGACTTTYHIKKGSIGYEDVQFDDTTFVVTYTATLNTPFVQVEEFATRRAAELTVEQGFSHYVVTKKEAKKVVPPCACPGITPFTRRVVNLEIVCRNDDAVAGSVDARAQLAEINQEDS